MCVCVCGGDVKGEFIFRIQKENYHTVTAEYFLIGFCVKWRKLTGNNKKEDTPRVSEWERGKLGEVNSSRGCVYGSNSWRHAHGRARGTCEPALDLI